MDSKVASTQSFPSTSLPQRRARYASTQSLDLSSIDAKWQPRWKEHAQWTRPDGGKGKYYALPMFPYPSGTLHIGHLRNYTISDVIARFRRMQGYKVLHPIGWDAFGLPAENAAIERSIDPAEWTMSNINNMKQQIEAMGGCWDWEKEIRTCDPDFYKETQRLFLRLHEHGFAYQATASVNYDPVDRTVLANEQVDANGFSWRSGAKVEKRRLQQWFIKITELAPRLLDELKLLEPSGAWPARVVAMQRNWLGKSDGASFRFTLTDGTDNELTKHVDVFTTRPDTIFGVQYVALALDHPVVQRLATASPPLQAFIEEAGDSALDSKAGYLLPGLAAENPLQTVVKEHGSLKAVPVFVAPYVKSDYASGAVMGVPAHDDRDFGFWQSNRPSTSRQAKTVIIGDNHSETHDNSFNTATPFTPFTGTGRLSQDCQQYSGLSSAQGGQQIVKDLHASNPQIASFKTSWRLRDWLISRQRYWGTPIPIIHCHICGIVPVPEDDLPVKLPSSTTASPEARVGNLLETHKEWRHVQCPRCHGQAQRETDTMDTFVDSSWYYLSFARAAASTTEEQYMPVDLYIGGVEHAILHLLYARFIAKFLSDTTPSLNEISEPFSRLLTQGMVHGRTFRHLATGQYLKPADVDASSPGSPRLKSSGERVAVSFEKMSKSKHNGVDPVQCMRKHGADITRAHLLFQAPVSEILEWDEDKIVGIQRWFVKIWQLVHEITERSKGYTHQDLAAYVKTMERPEAEMWKAVQTAITSIEESLARTYALNTVISDLMSLTNALIQYHGLGRQTLSPLASLVEVQSCATLLRLLIPVAPSFGEECWEILNRCDSMTFKIEETASRAGFPKVDGSLESMNAQNQTCAIQVNGKLRFVTTIASAPDEYNDEEVREWVLHRVLNSEEGTKAQRQGRLNVDKAKKIVIVKRGKTVNIVL
ncbi:MAG: Leucyl-tRNA synthetase, mitochondrial [Chrysothrix sp. TS-e1954]|nr:MAG: Leucyl-tRNA synthetase, mitochondrial [Chrysothrix sp. TS-e1954]